MPSEFHALSRVDVLRENIISKRKTSKMEKTVEYKNKQKATLRVMTPGISQLYSLMKQLSEVRGDNSHPLTSVSTDVRPLWPPSHLPLASRSQVTVQSSVSSQERTNPQTPAALSPFLIRGKCTYSFLETDFQRWKPNANCVFSIAPKLQSYLLPSS